MARTGSRYAWAPVEGGNHFRKMTLCDQCEYQDVSPRKIDAAVTAALDTLRPDVVAIPGWSTPEALAALRWVGLRNVPAVLMSESVSLTISVILAGL